MLNRELLRGAKDEWTDDAIRRRTKEMAEVIVQIWPVPAGHKSGFDEDKRPRARKNVRLADLINAGALEPGMHLFPRRRRLAARVATLLPDGQIEVDGVAYPGPSEAATAVAGRRTNGSWFFLTDQAAKRSLRAVRREFVDAMSVDVEDDEADDDDGDEN